MCYSNIFYNIAEIKKGKKSPEEEYKEMMERGKLFCDKVHSGE